MNRKDLEFFFNFETKTNILAEIHNLDNKTLLKEMINR